MEDKNISKQAVADGVTQFLWGYWGDYGMRGTLFGILRDGIAKGVEAYLTKINWNPQSKE